MDMFNAQKAGGFFDPVVDATTAACRARLPWWQPEVLCPRDSESMSPLTSVTITLRDDALTATALHGSISCCGGAEVHPAANGNSEQQTASPHVFTRSSVSSLRAVQDIAAAEAAAPRLRLAAQRAAKAAAKATAEAAVAGEWLRLGKTERGGIAIDRG